MVRFSKTRSFFYITIPIFLFLICLVIFCGFAQNLTQSKKLYNKAKSLEQKSEYLKAANIYDEVAEKELTSEPSDTLLAVLALDNAGWCYYSLEEYPKALEYYDRALSVSGLSINDTLIARIFRHKGQVLGDMNEEQEALTMYKNALQIYKQEDIEERVALTLNDMGVLFSALGEIDTALQKHKKSLSIYEQLGDAEGIAENYHYIGIIYYKAGKYDETLELFTKALESYRETGMQKDVAHTLNWLGIVLRDMGENDAALQKHKESLSICEQLGEAEGIAFNYYNIGIINYEAGEYGEAIDKFIISLEIYKELGSSEYIWSTLYQIGEAYNYWGKTNEAIGYYEEAAELLVAEERFDFVHIVYKKIADRYNLMGERDKALEFYNQALEIAKAYPDERIFISDYQNDIGIQYNSWGNYDLAIDYYNKAIESSKKYNNGNDIELYLNNIGLVEYSRGNYRKAIEYFEKGLAISTKLQDKDNIAIALNNLGLVYQAWGRFDEALMNYEKALKIAKESLDKNEQVAYLINIGNVYGDWLKYEMAEKYYLDALSIVKESGDKVSEGALLNNIGLIHSAQGFYEEALENYRVSLDIAEQFGEKSSISLCLRNIGSVFEELNEYDSSLIYYEKSLEIAEELGAKLQVSSNLLNIGYVYHYLRRHEKQIEYCNQALSVASELESKDIISFCLTCVGWGYANLGQYDKAIEYLESSVIYMEELRQTAPGDIRRDYFEALRDPYALLTYAYLFNNNISKAFGVVERSRTKFFAEQLQRSKMELAIPSVYRVQELLSDDEAMIMYSDADWDSIFVIAITGDLITSFAISSETLLSELLTEDEAYLEDAIKFYLSYLSYPLWGIKFHEMSRTFYDQLVHPLHELVQDKDRLTIITDGTFGFLPFETLIDKNGKYLAETHTIKYIQSARIWNFIKSKDPKNKKRYLLAVGGAVYNTETYTQEIIENKKMLAYLERNVFDSISTRGSLTDSYASLGYSEWPNLPGSMQEIEKISSIISPSDMISGKAATEDKIKEMSSNGKLSEYKMLHFATHGVVVSDLPELSAVVLSQFENALNDEDGYLTMGEIADLDIKADFVNLSACETGLGKIYAGEGVVGLTQGFILAGANSVSVSLWPIADEATSEFMVSVYSKIAKGEDYPESIMNTKREFISGVYGEEYTHPFYWAPFVYYGK